MTTTTTFSYTGAAQTFTVPAGVTSIQVALTGAGTSAGGAGDKVNGTLAVTPGQVLNLFVGGQGGAAVGGTAGPGGFNGGAAGGNSPAGSAGGFGGGGATDIRIGGTALANRVCVAGAGGGSGRGTGGAGGNANANGSNGTISGGGGHFGTAAAGGAGGTGVPNGSAGASGVGGAGSSSTAATGGGGGGGGGYFGGGGGGNGNNVAGNVTGGGGGGSNYLGAMTATSVNAAVGTGNGSITLTYDQPPSAPTLNSPANNSNIDVTLASITFSWTFADPDTGDSSSAFGFQYRAVGSGIWISAQAVTTPSVASSLTLAMSNFTAGTQYEWQVQNADASGVVGPWSSSSLFTPQTPPAAPTVTSPLSTVSGNPQTVTWTTPSSQVNYQIRTVGDTAGAPNTALVYTDTGSVSSALLTGTVPITFTSPMHIQVRYQHDSGVWSPWGDSGALTLNLVPPATPTLTLTPSTVDGSITAAITNPAGNAASSNDLYRTDMSLGLVRFEQDWLADGAIVTKADTGQAFSIGSVSQKILSGGISPNASVGSVNSWISAAPLGTQKVLWAACDFLFGSTGSSDGGSVVLQASVAGYSDANTTPDTHMQLVINKTGWSFNVVSGGALTSVVSGSFATALSYNTEYHAEIYVVSTNQVRVTLPDGSFAFPINTLETSIQGSTLVARMSMTNAATDHAPIIRRLYADTVAPAEYRIATGLQPNGSYKDCTPASGVNYRYRVVAIGAFGGSTSST